MKTKGRRVLKNGTIGAYVYDSKTKKWNWRFIGRQKGGMQSTRRRRRNPDEVEANVQRLTHNKGVEAQLIINNLGRRTKNVRGTNLNHRSAYEKERDALLDYLDDKISRTSRLRLKRRSKLQNIANYVRNSYEGEFVTPNDIVVPKNLATKRNVEVLQKAYYDIGLILASGTKNDPQRFKNLTNQVVKHRLQRKRNNRRTNQEAQVVVNNIMRNTNRRS